MEIQLITKTDPGRVRELNEDNVFAQVRSADLGTPLALLVVADGMGGHQAGEVASQLAVDTIQKQLSWFLERHEMDDTQPLAPVTTDETRPTDFYETRLRLAIMEANRAIYQHGQDNPDEAGNLGTTVTCALIKEDYAIIANVGDSRTYHLRAGALEQVTEDHSYVGYLVRMGEIAPEDVYDHPQRSLITRALGNKPTVQIDVWTRKLQPDDQLLLCSDGLWEMIRGTKTIQAALSDAESVLDSAETLVNLANQNGGEDNIGVAIAKIIN